MYISSCPRRFLHRCFVRRISTIYSTNYPTSSTVCQATTKSANSPMWLIELWCSLDNSFTCNWYFRNRWGTIVRDSFDPSNWSTGFLCLVLIALAKCMQGKTLYLSFKKWTEVDVPAFVSSRNERCSLARTEINSVECGADRRLPRN